MIAPAITGIFTWIRGIGPDIACPDAEDQRQLDNECDNQPDGS
jgi:hypothetical protein